MIFKNIEKIHTFATQNFIIFHIEKYIEK